MGAKVWACDWRKFEDGRKWDRRRREEQEGEGEDGRWGNEERLRGEREGEERHLNSSLLAFQDFAPRGCR
eukprot:745724-Hanusia_phi.AAC.1